MTSSERRSDVSAFLDEYNEAFASIDGHRIAALLPSAYRDSAGRGSIHCLQSREELASFFQVSQTYQRDGYVGGRFDDPQVSPIGGRQRAGHAVLEDVARRR